MTRYAVLDGSNVVNVIEAEAGFMLEGFDLVASDVASPGWTYDAGEFSPPVVTPAVPASVTPRQARLALIAGDHLDAVEAAVQAADRATQVTWEFATEVRRDDPLIAAIGAQLGLSAADIDDLFVLAATL